MAKTIGKEPTGPRRVSESPLNRLKRGKDALNVYELTAADELIAAWRMQQGLQVARDTDLGIRSEPRADAADSVAAHRVDLIAKFRVWRTDLQTVDRNALAATTGVLFEERAMRTVEEFEQWRHGTARGHLLVGLRHFAALRGNVPRGVRNWKLTV